MTPLILSADDFGLDDGIDAAVIDLAARGRLTATSCLTGSPRWQEAARSLTPAIRAQLDVGLHLDFTEFHPLMSWSGLVARSYARKLPRRALQKRIAEQLDAFEEAMGTTPDYVDGHRHIHQLPQIRSALLIELERRYGSARPWIRISRPPPGNGFKGAVIRLLGSKELTREAAAAGFSCTRRLLGVYGFDLSASACIEKLHYWLELAQPFDALMVHVAQHAPSDDPIGRARVAEYQALSSDAFASALLHKSIRLTTGGNLFSSQVQRHAGATGQP